MPKAITKPYERLEQMASYINSCNSIDQISSAEIRRILGWPRLSGRRKADVKMLIDSGIAIDGTREPRGVAIGLCSLVAYLRSSRTVADLNTLGRQRRSADFNRIVGLCDKAFK